VTASVAVDFYPYLLLSAGEPVYSSHWEVARELQNLGFKVNPNRRLCQSQSTRWLAFCVGVENNR